MPSCCSPGKCHTLGPFFKARCRLDVYMLCLLCGDVLPACTAKQAPRGQTAVAARFTSTCPAQCGASPRVCGTNEQVRGWPRSSLAHFLPTCTPFQGAFFSPEGAQPVLNTLADPKCTFCIPKRSLHLQDVSLNSDCPELTSSPWILFREIHVRRFYAPSL